MNKVKILPKDDNANGWSRILTDRPPRPSLASNLRAPWVVIGAGFAGLAAARRLATNRPNDRIVVLEAGCVGEGASGRNSGFGIDLPHTTSNDIDVLNHSHAYIRVARSGLQYLEDAVNQHGIQCDWNRAGKYHAAASKKGVHDILNPYVDELKRLGEPYRWVDRDQLQKEIGTPHFEAAVYTPGCILMNPAALTRGLADSLPDNVELYEKTPVTAYDFEADGKVELVTPGGTVLADKAIVAVNAFSKMFGLYRNAIVPLAAHATLTRPLNASECSALGGVDNWGLTPANSFAGITMRFTQDHRILIRQNIHYCGNYRQSDQRRASIQRDHEILFHQRFPMLPKVTMAHTWTGFICVSRNHAPGFGRFSDRVFSAVCQNAVGVANGTCSGVLIADMACGVDNSLIADMTSFGQPAPVPPRPFLDLGVKARFAWELFRARHEA